jgi:sugar lactone lactonase YvrE
MNRVLPTFLALLFVALALVPARAQDVLVSSFNLGEIKRYDASGSFLGNFATMAVAGPTQMAKDSAGRVYVANYGTGEVLQYSPTGTFLATFATVDVGGPFGLAIDASDNVYVTGYYDATLRRFDSSGSLLSNTPTGLGDPATIAIGSNGNLFIANSDTPGGIYQFSPTGTPLGLFASLPIATGLVFAPSGELFASSGDGNIYRFDSSGSALGSFAAGFSLPEGLLIHGGNLLVADSAGSAIQAFDFSGSNLGAFATPGGGPVGLLSVASAPEPETIALLSLGLPIALIRRRKR